MARRRKDPAAGWMEMLGKLAVIVAAVVLVSTLFWDRIQLKKPAPAPGETMPTVPRFTTGAAAQPQTTPETTPEETTPAKPTYVSPVE